MTNELIIIGIVVLDLSIVLLAWRLGKEWLIATILANVLLTMIFEAKLAPVFGTAMTCGAIFYSSIFIATDILSEHHGKKIAYQSIWLGFLVIAIFAVLSQLIIQLVSIEENQSIADAMRVTFELYPRIATAGFIAYLTAQSIDIWIFHAIRTQTGFQKLWLRNNASTLISLVIDTCVFFPLAFFGTVSLEVLGSLMLTGWLVKAPVAILDTPFMYLSYIVVGKTPPDFGKMKHLESEAPAASIP